MDERAYATLNHMLWQREQVLARTEKTPHHEEAVEQLLTGFSYAVEAFRTLDLVSPEEAEAWRAAYPEVPSAIARAPSREAAAQVRDRLQQLIDAEIAAVRAERRQDHAGFLRGSTLISAGQLAQLLTEDEAEALHFELTAHLRNEPS